MVRICVELTRQSALAGQQNCAEVREWRARFSMAKGTTVPTMPSRRLSSSFPWRMAAFLVLLTLCLVSFSPAAVSLKIEWKNQRLSVKAERVPLSMVLREVIRKTRIQIQGLDQLQGNMVSARFSTLPLDDALKRLLVNVNYALVQYKTPPKGNPSGLVLIVARQGGKSSNLARPGGTELNDERAARAARLEPKSSGVQLEDEKRATEAARQRTSGLQPGGDDRSR
jgi:hypothetical protein